MNDSTDGWYATTHFLVSEGYCPAGPFDSAELAWKSLEINYECEYGSGVHYEGSMVWKAGSIQYKPLMARSSIKEIMDIDALEHMTEDRDDWKRLAIELGACPECRTIRPYICKMSCDTGTHAGQKWE